jgi:hypothetical protein
VSIPKTVLELLGLPALGVPRVDDAPSLEDLIDSSVSNPPPPAVGTTITQIAWARLCRVLLVVLVGEGVAPGRCELAGGALSRTARMVVVDFFRPAGGRWAMVEVVCGVEHGVGYRLVGAPRWGCRLFG